MDGKLSFPFTEADGVHSCPKQFKIMLQDKYKLNKVPAVVKFFNHYNLFGERFSTELEQDIDLEAQSDYELNLFQDKLFSSGQDIFMIKILTDNDLSWEEPVLCHSEMTIYDFKRKILSRNNQPFFLEIDINNHWVVGDLLKLTDQQMENNEGEVKVFFNLHKW